MKRTIVGLALCTVLVATAPAQGAKGVKYKGKTSSGHPITFTLKGKRLYEMRSGIRVSCISIQGAARPPAASTPSATAAGFR